MIPTSELERFISGFEKRMAPVERAADEAWWKLATTGTDEAQEEFVRAGKEYNRLFSDPDEYRSLQSWYEERDTLESPLLRRQVEVLYRTFAERQGDEEILGRIEELEAEANAVYGNHRSVVRGKKMGENEVRELLRLSEDQDLRREAWEASKSVGREVEGTVRELARLRNQLAREQGYENYYARSLELQDIEAGDRRKAQGEVRGRVRHALAPLRAVLPQGAGSGGHRPGPVLRGRGPGGHNPQDLRRPRARRAGRDLE
jgi:peptidyl-dipeptidase A